MSVILLLRSRLSCRFPTFKQTNKPFFNILFQHPELFRWFKDFVGFKEGAMQPEPAPSPLPQPRQERISGDAAMEIGNE